MLPHEQNKCFCIAERLYLSGRLSFSVSFRPHFFPISVFQLSLPRRCVRCAFAFSVFLSNASAFPITFRNAIQSDATAKKQRRETVYLLLLFYYWSQLSVRRIATANIYAREERTSARSKVDIFSLFNFLINNHESYQKNVEY